MIFDLRKRRKNQESKNFFLPGNQCILEAISKKRNKIKAHAI